MSDKSVQNPTNKFFEKYTRKINLGMRAKLISLFIVIKVIPLVLLAFLVWEQAQNLGTELLKRTKDLAQKSTSAIEQTGNVAIEDSKRALELRARADIERMTTDAAQRVASFLYARDANIRYGASLPTSKTYYQNFINNNVGRLIKQGEWVLSSDEKNWVAKKPKKDQIIVTSSIEENIDSFSYRVTDGFTYEERPLFLEMTFVDLKGQERIKATTSNQVSSELKDISKRQNTYAHAETYFEELAKLKKGEIYVSDVIGTYVPSKVIGKYIPEETKKRGLKYEPEKSAFSGKENPVGKRFKGVIRWATPVYKNNVKIGYVTLALDHDHIMEFMDHITPEIERYIEISDAYEGNYAFIWDYKGRSVVHPRHHSITGYHPETGAPQIPWLEKTIYDAWQESGKTYIDFLETQETFVEQSRTKKPSIELIKQGFVGLDCRYLNFAPQCTGWFDLTSRGGSGSFSILWSGLLKITTAATIPYFTGQYANYPRGFGFVAVGSGIEEFHRPAMETKAVIDKMMEETSDELAKDVEASQAAIEKNLADTAASITISTILMTVLVIFIAMKMASSFTGTIKSIVDGLSIFQRGERQFRFNSNKSDEIGTLCNSFDQMADSIVNSDQGLLVITDLEGNIIYGNATFLSLISKDIEDIKGEQYEAISLFGKNNPLHCFLNNLEFPIHYQPSSNTYIKGIADKYNDSEGNQIGYIIQSYDVTEIVNLQKSTEEERVLLSTLFSTSPDILWYKNVNGECLFANDRFLSICGKSMTEIQGQQEHEFMSKEFVDECTTYDTIAKKHGKPVISQSTTEFADGHTEIVETVRAVTINAEGQIIGILSSARDVSDRVAVEEKLLKIQNELRAAVNNANRASAAKSNFLAHMSHEIRTPMNAMIGISTVVKHKLEEPLPSWKEVRKHIEQIETSGNHLSTLINDILEMSKVELEKLTISNEDFDFNKLVDDACIKIEQPCKNKNIKFNMHMDSLDSSIVSSDPLRLRQVLITLLATAVKYTPESEEIDFDITNLGRQDDATKLKFTIKIPDTEIPPEIMSSLFASFEHGQVEVVKDFNSSNLELFISQSIVNLLGGKIEILKSVNGKNIFTFTILLSDARQAEAQSASLDTSILSGKRILLVDDIEINRMIVLEMLSEMNIDIDEAIDGKDALDQFGKAKENYYDLILMDIQMPIIGGYECTRQIRELTREDAKSIPIIALSANSFKEDVQESLDSGMNDHLAKPIDYDDLLAILVKYLS